MTDETALYISNNYSRNELPNSLNTEVAEVLTAIQYSQRDLLDKLKEFRHDRKNI